MECPEHKEDGGDPIDTQHHSPAEHIEEVDGEAIEVPENCKCPVYGVDA